MGWMDAGEGGAEGEGGGKVGCGYEHRFDGLCVI